MVVNKITRFTTAAMQCEMECDNEYIRTSYLVGAFALLVCSPWSSYSCLHLTQLHLVGQVYKDLTGTLCTCILHICSSVRMKWMQFKHAFFTDNSARICMCIAPTHCCRTTPLYCYEYYRLYKPVCTCFYGVFPWDGPWFLRTGIGISGPIHNHFSPTFVAFQRFLQTCIYMYVHVYYYSNVGYEYTRQLPYWVSSSHNAALIN